jgi:uncharacterized protein
VPLFCQLYTNKHYVEKHNVYLYNLTKGESMEFLDRQEEMSRLERLTQAGGLAVIWGRRRIGKSRLLLEWCKRHDGLYTVADQSAAPIQRRYFAAALATRFPGFDQVEYPDWRSLLARLAAEATHRQWDGPLIIDEFPNLVAASPELPSILQAWTDNEAKAARLAVALAGSSQRMMQGLVMEATEPLYGRAAEAFHLRPLPAGYLNEALRLTDSRHAVQAYTVWGGVPRYWELMSDLDMSIDTAVDHLVLNPLGILHEEPERLLLEELPPAVTLRPILDAIGLGAHRVSEIAARIGEPATSMHRPLRRLKELGLIRREIPFGTPSASAKRSLYKIADPFCRLWFRVVAPNRGFLANAPAKARIKLWGQAKPRLMAAAWEELSRDWVASGAMHHPTLGKNGDWEPARRFWHGNGPEWDVVSQTLDKRCMLLGEAKWSEHPFDLPELHRLAKNLVAKGIPSVKGLRDKGLHHLLFVPEVVDDIPGEVAGVQVVTAERVLGAMK